MCELNRFNFPVWSVTRNYCIAVDRFEWLDALWAAGVSQCFNRFLFFLTLPDLI